MKAARVTSAYAAGVDVGSTYTKALVLDGHHRVA